MCEGRISLEEAKMLMADLTARKNAKQPKLTTKQWLNQYKDCSHCKFQATCHHNPGQPGQYNACCKWDGETTMSLMKSLEKAKERGEVTA